ncbi:MAG: hypothetical protein ACMVO5_10805 [Polymorphobacter sp.]|uniref:hypothetical protein n=1 Tax=Polymorphobacter sp. TaxID=1909290 RepID=UPI003A8983C0
MAPGIAVIMVVGTGALVAAAWWLIEAIAPRKMAERTVRQIALHKAAVEALDVAIPRAGNDAAQAARLTASREWHLAALNALAPAEAAALNDTTPLAQAA